ncbi:hypothetical protein NUM3379_35180 [Kineococcus sp. NUM-3379]
MKAKIQSLLARRRAHSAGEVTPQAAAQMERDCADLLDRMDLSEPFKVDEFLGTVSSLVAAPIYLLDMDEEWQEALRQVGDHTSAFTVPLYDGFGIMWNRSIPTLDAVVLGHEGAHVFFGDVRRGTGPAPVPHEPLRVPSPYDENGKVSELLLLGAARTYELPPDGQGSPRLVLDPVRESRAERLATLAAARATGRGGGYKVDPISAFFRADG